MEEIEFFKEAGKTEKLMEKSCNIRNTLIISMKRRKGKCITATYFIGMAGKKKMEKEPQNVIELRQNMKKESNFRQGDTIRMVTEQRKLEPPLNLLNDLPSTIT